MKSSCENLEHRLLHGIQINFNTLCNRTKLIFAINKSIISSFNKENKFKPG